MPSLTLNDYLVFFLYFIVVTGYGYWVYRKKKKETVPDPEEPAWFKTYREAQDLKINGLTDIIEAQKKEKTTADLAAKVKAHDKLKSIPASFLKASSKLELLQLNTAGADAYILPGVLAPNTILTNATGAYGKAVAEHMFTMMLSLQKKLHLFFLPFRNQ